MRFSGLKIKNFACFGGEGIHIENLSTVNIFIGENNCGKSNSLRMWSFLESLPFPDGYQIVNFPIEDTSLFYKFNPNSKIEIEFYFDDKDNEIKEITDPLGYRGVPYFKYSLTRNGETNYSLQLVESFVHDCEEFLIRNYVVAKMGVSGGTLQDRTRDVINLIQPGKFISIPHVEHIDEFRKLTNEKEIRKALHSVIQFSYKNPENKKKKEKLNKFIENVLGYPAEITIPDIEDEIEIIIEDFHQPLHKTGTGVHEIILIGLKLFLLNEKSLVCIDEPELHLHPRVQRSFLNFISKETDHIYFIATHSNSFLDFQIENKQIYRVFKDTDSIKIKICPDIQSQRSILEDLGVRASELLQTNGIIWVEGPSDRIYIKKWVQILNPNLIEGLHFNFQYYGGRLLNHYSIENSEFNEFLNILTVNNNAVIVMDSDCLKPHTIEDLNKTKQRIIKECGSNNIEYWVTSGREIENYISNEILEKICGEPIKRDKFIKIKTYCKKFNPDDKIAFARDAIDLMSESEIEDNFDLKEKIQSIVRNIENWNDL